MSRIEKLERRIRSLQSDIEFEELKVFLEYYGFYISRSSGSHFIFKAQSERLVIACNKKHIAKYQLKQAVCAVDRIIDTANEQGGLK